MFEMLINHKCAAVWPRALYCVICQVIACSYAGECRKRKKNILAKCNKRIYAIARSIILQFQLRKSIYQSRTQQKSCLQLVALQQRFLCCYKKNSVIAKINKHNDHMFESTAANIHTHIRDPTRNINQLIERVLILRERWSNTLSRSLRWSSRDRISVYTNMYENVWCSIYYVT